MLKKTALSDIRPLELLHNGGATSIGMVRTASNRILIEPNSEKSKIVEAEIKKHPNAIFFRAKAIEANVPNTNGDYFSEEELFKAHKTFEGVPFFTNHDNQNIENAKGKIIFAEWVPEEKAVYTISFVDRDAYPHIARSIEEEYVTGVSMGAVNGGTMVLMADLTEKPIEHVVEGDIVISHAGNCQKVLQTHCEYLGKDMYEFNTSTYHRSPLFTEDHPIFVIPKEQIDGKRKESLRLSNQNKHLRRTNKTDSFIGQDTWRKEKYSPVFKEAADIVENDYLMIPSKWFLSQSQNSESDLFYVYGAFLGDGYLRKDKNGEFEAVAFCFGLAEKELVEKISGILSKYSKKEICISVCPERNGLYLTIYDRNLAANIAATFGTGSKNKRIKVSVKTEENAKQLLAGYLDTDGCIVDRGNQDVRGNKFGGFQMSSTNIKLLEDIQSLLIALGSVSRISTANRIPGKNSVVNVNTIEHTLSVGSNNSAIFSNSIKYANSKYDSAEIKAGKSFITEVGGLKYMACPVKNINKIGRFDEPVYDLTVSGDESYIADGVAVHNCSVEYSVCNLCGNRAEKTDDYCSHIKNRKGRKFSGKVKNVVTGEIKEFKDEPCFEYNYGIKFIELSAVVDPACPSCHIQGIIPNDEYLKRVANLQNSLMMVKTAAIEKQAGQEEIQQLDGVLKTLEEIAIKLIQQRKQVEPEFASDLVQIITELQQWNDELVAAGYGNFQGEAGGAGNIPGTVGNMPQEGAPPQGAPAMGAPVPVSNEQPNAAPTEAVGQVSGSPTNPLVTGPNLPISAPVRPAASSHSIQRISDFSVERLKHGESLMAKVASISTRMDKSGEEIMGKRRTISAKLADKEKVVEVLTNSWKEKQEFSEYIKEVPSIQDENTRLSVKKQDDNFIIVAETKEGPVTSKVWTFDDLDDQQKNEIRQNPQSAAVALLESFSNSITKYREGASNMTDINKAAGASSVNKAPEVITQKQLDEKGLYHSRTGVEEEVVTQKQLDSVRTGEEADVVTQKQLDSGIRLNPRQNSEKDVVTQKQLDSARTGNEADVVTQKQLDAQRTGTEQDQVTERQLDKVDAPWARQSKRDPSKFKTAQSHMEGVIDTLADTVISCGCTPREVCDIVSDIVDSPKSRFDFANSIVEAPVQSSNVDHAQRLAYWQGRNFKIASADNATIADSITNGIRKLVSDETINPEIVVAAIDVVAEGGDAISAVAKSVDNKLASVESFKKKANIKEDLRKALASSTEDMSRPERDIARAKLIDSVNSSTSNQLRSAERANWTKKLAGKKADTMIETSFEEIGLPVKTASECRNDKLFKQTISSVAKGALLAKNLKVASITNVTISGNTIQIAVQTDDGEQSVEIPLGDKSGPDNSEIMPEGDLSGEGLDQGMMPTASAKNMKRKAQVPAGGGMPGAPGGAAMPGGAETGGVPGGAPGTDPIQALTTGDEAMPEEPADEIPSSSDRQMPLAICPECGSNDVDISKEENGASKGKCNACGSEYEALVKKTIEFVITKGKEDEQGAGSGGPEPEAPMETPEVPALPVAAQTRLDRKTIVRIGNNQKVHGHVCPACGTKQCKASVDRGGHTEYACSKCGTDVVKDVIVNKNKPEEAYMRLAWNVFPDVKGCPSCEEKAKQLVAKIKMEGLLKKASAEKDNFPMTNCMERIARKYGGDTVASYGPCKGKLVADCVCKELQRLGFRTVRHMERLASASLEVDPMAQCMQDQKSKGLDTKQASSICACVKNKVLAEARTKDPLVAEAMDNIYLSAFLDDIKSGKEKTVTAAQLIALKEIDSENAQKRLEQKIAAKDAELDQDIGAPLPVIVNLKQEKKEAMDSKLVTRVAATPTVIETIEKDVSSGVPRKNQTLGKEGPDNIDVPMAKPSVPRSNATMGKEGPENINPSVGLPDVPRSNAFMGGEADAQSGLPANNNEIKGTVIAEITTDDVITKKAKTLKEVDTVENNADVPRGKATMGEEGKDNIDVDMAKPDVPRKNQTLGEEGADNIDVKENKADVPMGDAYMGDEKNTQKGMPANNDEYLKNVAAGKKRDAQLERIAQARMNEAIKTASWLAANQRIASDKPTFDNVVKALANFELGQISTVAEQLFPARQVKTASATTETKEASGYAIPAMHLESKQAASQDDFAKRLSSQFTIGSSKFDKDLTIYGEK